MFEAVDEALFLGLGADQPQVGEIAAIQNRFGDAQVQVVLVGPGT